MQPRMNYFGVAPKALQPMLEMEKACRASGLDHSLYELVKIRASQINGCAFCIHMHTNEARAHGETDDRMHLLAAWPESPLFSPRERAALAWTEALTLVSQTHAPDDVYDELGRHFTEEEIVKLTMMIVTINGWNRLSVGFRSIHPVETASDAA
ncbi:carboxymuconolactone decarboxylase family protein [Caenispirillum bisanense]|uniref:Alkylhydroperoxidase AhpD family core domain-containing protein n=1 Tax=Caenispirillum bisanense TaxID=414052 RepID=A0A286GZ35_9PROT|nr:carboxymuconolactone decarboxylase family protein [Caenispirillum bisanense]SOE00798.1 alkylhydroperoxidase AhpD family core domain-containing protein [Caenispirillum bisanense]